MLWFVSKRRETPDTVMFTRARHLLDALLWFDAMATVAISQMRKQAQVGWHTQSFLESQLGHNHGLLLQRALG